MSSVLEAKNIVKIYPGTVALDDVSVTFKSGEVHALIGKNGSGKSTLLKIISGAETKTSGTILLDGKELNITKPQDAFSLGIETVYQEMSLLPALSVGENIFLGRLPKKGAVIDWARVHKESQAVLDDLGININSHTKVGELSVGQQQMVEIAKAMSNNPAVLQLDEPTSAIATNEVEALFKVVRRLKEKDVIIVYVSHRLHELWEICDVCTVFRDGHYIGTKEMKTMSHGDLTKMMFGDVSIKQRPSDIKVTDEVVLRANNICYKDKVDNVSFELKKGEVLGIAGMLGSGRTELLSSIFGSVQMDSGDVEVFGEKIAKPTPRIMAKHKVAMTQEDRKSKGLVVRQPIIENLGMSSIDETGKGIQFDHKLCLENAKKQINDLQIKIGGVFLPCSSLSGGNQQKIVIGKWLTTNPEIMLFDEPSRGIDVAAKQQIFEIMWNGARKGISSVMVSTELEELLEVCNRILVMKAGHIVGELKDPSKVTVDQLYSYCMGEEIK